MTTARTIDTGPAGPASARPSRLAQAFALIAFLAIVLGVQFLGSIWAGPALDPWYRELAKPAWTPPDIAFPIVWTVLYLLMGVAAWQLWRSAPPGRAGWPLFAFFVQLALNLAWPYAFFGLGDVVLGFVTILALLLAILATMTAFAQVSRPAAWMLAPYVLWVAYGATLNGAIVEMNYAGGM